MPLLAVTLLAPLLVGAADRGEAPPWPAGSDVKYLTHDGAAVGPFEKLRAPGKYTVFDLYADWCGPCKLVDRHLRAVVAHRKDVAVRKLNIVDWDSPLAKQMGPDFETLPFVVVISPAGTRTEILGANLNALNAALARR
jgi:thiol-disulfide isomerase/thioredoxin